MKSNGFRNIQLNLSGLRFWLVLAVILWLISSVGLWWLVKSFFILIGIILFLPLIIFLGFRFWLQRNLINADCPVCGQSLIGINGQQLQCTNCGEALIASDSTLKRVTPPGTVDVDVVDVSVSELPD